MQRRAGDRPVSAGGQGEAQDQAVEVDHRARARDRARPSPPPGRAAAPALLQPRATWSDQFIAAATAVAFCVFASACHLRPVRQGARACWSRGSAPRTRPSSATRSCSIGAVTTLVVTLVLFDVPVGQLLLGGALTSVFVGIAAQQALSNVFAGLVLLLARPFKVGDSIRLQAGALSGEIDGTVSEIGITYVRLATDGGMVSVPNSQVLNAVVGPIPPQAEEEDSPVTQDGKSGTPGGPEHSQPRPGQPA